MKFFRRDNTKLAQFNDLLVRYYQSDVMGDAAAQKQLAILKANLAGDTCVFPEGSPKAVMAKAIIDGRTFELTDSRIELLEKLVKRAENQQVSVIVLVENPNYATDEEVFVRPDAQKVFETATAKKAFRDLSRRTMKKLPANQDITAIYASPEGIEKRQAQIEELLSGRESKAFELDGHQAFMILGSQTQNQEVKFALSNQPQAQPTAAPAA